MPMNIATYPAVVGAILVARRKSRNQSQAEVAKAVGLSVSTWSRIENGESALTIEQLALAAEVLDLRPSAVLAAAEEKIAALSLRGVGVSPGRDDLAAGAAAGALPLVGASLAGALGPVGWLASAASAAVLGYKLIKQLKDESAEAEKAAGLDRPQQK